MSASSQLKSQNFEILNTGPKQMIHSLIFIFVSNVSLSCYLLYLYIFSLLTAVFILFWFFPILSLRLFTLLSFLESFALFSLFWRKKKLLLIIANFLFMFRVETVRNCVSDLTNSVVSLVWFILILWCICMLSILFSLSVCLCVCVCVSLCMWVIQ